MEGVEHGVGIAGSRPAAPPRPRLPALALPRVHVPRVAALLAAAVALGWLGLCARTPALPVGFAVARQGPLAVQVHTNGKVEPIDQAEVRARLDGRVVEIPDPGTRVDAGGVLLRIDDGPVAAALAAAESERLSAKESLRAARDQLEQVTRTANTDADLFRQQAVTRERYEESQAQLRDARARVEFLERDVPLRVGSLDLRIQELQGQLEAAVVRAPFAGTVYDTAVKRDQTLRAGDPVLHFADLDRLRVRANVDQVDLGRVAVGQEVHIGSNAYPQREWAARISELIPHVVLKDSRFVAEALAAVQPPATGLVPGMTVDVDVLVDSVPDALQVPAEAIFVDDEGSYVYRIEGNRVHRVPVAVGRSTAATVEVTEGLRPQDRVAVGAVEGLVDGARVEVKQRDDG